MWRVYLLLALLLCGCGDQVDRADWTPPDHPNGQWILFEADNDTRGHRYQMALAKHLWFHKNAVKNEPALAGVRLSFALSSWHDLGVQYPPAMTALVAVRDEAQDSVRLGNGVFEAMMDFRSLNDVLGERAHTRDLFVALDQSDPERARKIFRLAVPALVTTREYELCGKYLQPRQDLARAIDTFRQSKGGLTGVLVGDIGRKSFTNEVATLVALLALNHRDEEAAEMARLARAEWDDPAFGAALDTGLKGEVPEPWPM